MKRVYRKILEVNRQQYTEDGHLYEKETLLTLDCGHVNAHVNHFTYKVNSEIPCHRCDQENRKQA